MKLTEQLRRVSQRVSRQRKRDRDQKRRSRRNQVVVETLEKRMPMVASLQAMLASGHADLNISTDGSQWAIGPRDSSVSPEVGYANDEAAMYVGSPSQMTRPANSAYDFIGVGAGEDFYLLPQSQDPDLLFLGFAAAGVTGTLDQYNAVSESKGRVGSGSGDWLKVSLASVTHTHPDGTPGDGDISVWQAGIFGGANVFLSSFDDGISNPNGNGLDLTDGISDDDALWILDGSHSHYNIAFTDPGRYEVGVTLSGYFGDDGLSTANQAGYSESEEISLYFSVMSVGQLQFAADSYSVDEDAGTASIDVIRTGGSDGRLTVDYGSADGSATAGSDYSSVSGTLEFLDGETVKTISVPITDDAADEIDESFTLQLSSPAPAGINDYLVNVEGRVAGLLGASTTASVTIVDNDLPTNHPPVISSIENQAVSEATSTFPLAFTVGDNETDADDLTVVASSSNTSLVPNGNLSLGGSGTDRTLTVTPVSDQLGTTTITVTVTDGGGLQASETFELVVTEKSVVPFAPAESLGAGLDYVFEPKVSDIDGDGDIDVLAASLGAGKVVWFENLGDGSYGPERLVSDTATYTWEAHPVDLDADGDQDVVVGGFLGDLVWHENQGGSFGPAQSFDSDVYGPFIRSADLDGDGRPDVIVAPDGGGDVFWYRNEGNGAIGSRNVIATGLDTAAGIVVRDLNGDGRPEVITGESGADRLVYFVNEGSGTFGEMQTVESTAGAAVYASGDLDADGIDDLLVVGLDSLEVGYHPGLSDGTIGPMTALPSVNTPFAATSADFDQDGDQDVLIGSYGGPVVWLQNFGGGSFSEPLEITREVGQVNGIATADVDGDGDPDPVAAALARGEVFVIENLLGEEATTIETPASRTYPAGQNLDLSVHFGFPVTVSGTPSVSLMVGDENVEATYLSGSGTTELLFRYRVASTDVDDDGIELSGSSIDLHGGSITGPFGKPVDLSLPAVDLTGVLVNGAAPFVESVERASMTNPTAEGEVTFQVTFSEAMTGVDASDFGVTVDTVTEAMVTGVSGSGDEYLVTVSTGTGSGTIGLEILESVTAQDGEGNSLVEGFVGGEVFTINRRDARQITNFFTEDHGDIRIGYGSGAWNLDINPDALEGPFAADEVLIVGGPDSQVEVPSDSAFDFLGAAAGSDVYILPQSNVPPTIPNLGLGGSQMAPGTFASYVNEDPRVDESAPWVGLQLVGMRGPEGGEFSLYTSELDGPTVWIATSDGISDSDQVFIEARSHNHLNWAFTTPGIYEVDVFASAFLDRNDNGSFDEGVDRYTESGIVTYYFSIDPEGGPQPYTIAADPLPPVNVPFALPTYFGGEVNTNSWNSTTGDFNGDGNLDLVLGGSTYNSVTFLQGNGDGTFQPEVLLNAGADVISGEIVAIDYEGDGDLDFLSIERNQATIDGTADEGAISLYRNDGDANFTREVVKTGLLQGLNIAAGDLNGDGLADVAWGEYRYDGSVPEVLSSQSFALQEAGGQLGAATKLTDAGYGDIQIDDVDGDGNQDIVTSGYVVSLSPYSSVSELKVFLGSGDGTLADPVLVSTGANPEVQQVVDLNGDDRMDLLVYDRATESHVGYYPQLLDGSFGERVTLTPGYLYSQLSVAADINGDDAPDVVTYGYADGGYRLAWAPNLGGGVFGDAILISTESSNGGLHVGDVDNDNNPDILNLGSTSGERLAPVGVFLNKTGENPMVLLPPAARTRIGGDPIELQVYFGFPIDVTGTPRIALQVGENTVYADYLSGSGTPTLSFRYTVGESDFDLDGVQLASNLIDLNGGTLTDPIGGEAILEFPNLSFDGVLVNAVGPLVETISRVDATPTESDTVRFNVQFSADVNDVDVSDFSVRMREGDLSGAVVESVNALSGSLYEVTVSTGDGTGALGLSVNDSADITDSEGDILARGYEGGEVYTVRQQPIDEIDTYYTHGHADYRPVYENGEFTYIINPDDSLLPEPTYPSDEVITYLDNTALVTRGGDENYDFLGVSAGEPIYISDSYGSVTSVPYLGWEGGSLPRDVFADYKPSADSRVTSSRLREYVKVQMVDFRSSSDGDFSMYSGSSPTVWMATSDGITISDDDTSDAFWLYPGTHLHRNVTFTKPGTYEIDVVVSGYLDSNANDSLDATDVYVESGIQTWVFHVDTLGARHDAYLVGTSDTIEGSLAANDDWHENIGAPTYSVETAPAQGELDLHPDGTFTYTPADDFTGVDSFEYRLSNPRGGFTIANVTFTDSHSPVAYDDDYSIDEDETLTVGGNGVLENDIDPDGDRLTPAVVSGPQHGTLSLNPDGSFTYTPEADFNGTDSFTYTTTDVRYEVTPLGTLAGNTSYALDVNNLNQVTGNSGIVSGSSNPLHAFLWTDGSMEDLGVVAGTGSNNFSRGYALNDAGVVVGESDNSASKAFRWENGVIANLGTLGGSSAVAHDINNAGEIVGSSSNGTTSKPFVYVDGVMLELPTIAGNAGTTGRAWGISPDGRFIVGVTRADDAEFLSHATMWERQADGSYSVVDMGALFDQDHYSYAYAVNDAGNAVGASVVGTVSPTSSTSLYHGFVYHDGQMIDVGTLSHLGHKHSEVMDINATDQFVGYVAGFYKYPSFGGAAILGELLEGETAIVDLNDLVDAGSDWNFLSAEGINDGRSIVGYGKFNGSTRAFLLTPTSVDDDDQLFGNIATVTINVQAQPDAPTAMDDAFVVGRGSSVHGNVLMNDFDADGDAIVATLDATVMKGSLDFNADGSFVYTPQAGFDGSDHFSYSVTDSDGLVSTANVVVSAAAERSFEVMLTEGHVDIGLALGGHDHDHDHDHDDHGHDHDHGSPEGDPEWDLHVHDEENDAEYHPDEALLYVGMAGYTQRTGAIADAAYDFLGAAPGSSFYVLPAIESPELLFLGLGTEEIPVGTLLDGTATLQLKSVNGPGEFSVWESGIEGVDVRMATSDGVNGADQVVVQENMHRHVNFGFSKAGLYEITVQATGTLADGDVVVSDDVTYFFQVGNTVSTIDVANGQTQRSFVGQLDLVFAGDEAINEIADPSRIRLTQYDVNGENGFDVLDPARLPAMSVSENVIHLDWGTHGIGGNRASVLGNGMYRLSVDVDGDGEYDVDKYFHRLFGDVDGDGVVDQTDLDQIIAAIGTNDPESDVDGNRRVNAIDRILASRSLGQQLGDGSFLDD